MSMPMPMPMLLTHPNREWPSDGSRMADVTRVRPGMPAIVYQVRRKVSLVVAEEVMPGTTPYEVSA